MKNDRLRDLIFISLSAALTVICAYISIPLTVPITMQTFAVFFALNFLGARRGTLCALLYLSLGAIGLPVYSNGGAGIGVLFGATGGYMIGWVIAGLVMWLLEQLIGRALWAQGVSMLTGLTISYICGTAYFAFVYADIEGLWQVLSVCVIPFIIPDLIKLALALFLGTRMKKILSRVQ